MYSIGIVLIVIGLSVGCQKKMDSNAVSTGTSNLENKPLFDLSAIIHSGMSNDEVMDALGIVHPAQRCKFIGNTDFRYGFVISPRGPGLTITLHEVPDRLHGGWILVDWKASRNSEL